MGRNYLGGQQGDAANAVLVAVGYNFRLLLVWLSKRLRALLLIACMGDWTSAPIAYAA